MARQSLVPDTVARTNGKKDGTRHRVRYSPRLAALGLVHFSGWVPPHVLADLRAAEQAMRDHPHLTIGPLRDPVSGKFVSWRNGRAPAATIVDFCYALDDLRRLCTTYCEATGTRPSALGRLASNNHMVVARILKGRGCTMAIAEALTRYLTANWPPNLPRPKGLPRGRK